VAADAASATAVEAFRPKDEKKLPSLALRGVRGVRGVLGPALAAALLPDFDVGWKTEGRRNVVKDALGLLGVFGVFNALKKRDVRGVLAGGT